MYYDRDCGFCFRSCLLLRSFLVLPHAEIAAAQDSARARTLLEANRSWVVIDHDDHAYLKWPALVLLLRRSPLFFWLSWLLSGAWAAVPGNAAYDFLGRHRGRLALAIPSPREAAAGTGCKTATCAVGACLFLVLAWNLCSVGALPAGLRRWLAPLKLLRIDQQWNAFAPAPADGNGWFVFPGELSDGSAVDVLHPERTAVSYDEPADIALEYPNSRWRNYRQNLWLPQFADQRPYYGRYLCRSWNHSHPPEQALKGFKMIYMLQPAAPLGQPRTMEQRVLWRQECGGEARAEAAAAMPPAK
jgi:hypothetical protein